MLTFLALPSLSGTFLYFLDVSHTALGYKLRKRFWDPKDLDVDLKDKSFMVAGGNAGIGRSAAQTLAGESGLGKPGRLPSSEAGLEKRSLRTEAGREDSNASRGPYP